MIWGLLLAKKMSVLVPPTNIIVRSLQPATVEDRKSRRRRRKSEWLDGVRRKHSDCGGASNNNAPEEIKFSCNLTWLLLLPRRTQESNPFHSIRITIRFITNLWYKCRS